MHIKSWRFGEIQINEEKILKFPQGLPGLEDVHEYVLLQLEETNPINWLQSVDNQQISLPVMDPFEVFPDYAFDISEEDIKDLSISETEDIHVVSVLVIPEQINEMTINLAAPILINIRSNVGKQIIIDGSDYPVRHPVFEAITNIQKEVQGDAGSVSQNK